MDRRHFLLGASSASIALAGDLRASPGPSRRQFLILIDLAGGNDGANTLVPFVQPAYYRTRPGIAVPRGAVLPVSAGQGFHPSLRALMPLWDDGELAVLQGVGSTGGSLSHHRATEIMDGASFDDRPLQTGWLARVLSMSDSTRRAGVQAWSASSEQGGPLHGLPRCRRLHVDDENAGRFGFPADRLGCVLASACAALADGADVPAVHVTLDGFDTHENQPSAHGELLESLARSLFALRRALSAIGMWQDTLIMTRSEFGRLAHENLSAGTDHGNAGVQFLAGGRIRGGLRGQPLDYAALDERGAFLPTTDFRTVYAAVASRWLGVEVLASRPEAAVLDDVFRV